jgi:anti-anti-sigma factor
MGKKLRYVFHDQEGRLTLALAGEMDGSSAAELCYRIEKLGVSGCGLDFSQVEAIDLFGARVLARGLQALREHGVRFDLEGLPAGAAQTFCLGGVLEAIV